MKSEEKKRKERKALSMLVLITQIGICMLVPIFLCVFLGLLTGVGGGVLRDMMSREIPMVLCRRVYAIACIIGGVAYFLLRISLQESAAALIGVILVFVIRMLATRYRWSLPRISEDQQTEPRK